MKLAIAALLLVVSAAAAHADTSKLAKEDVPLQATATLRSKDKLCCGYPLVDDQGWALRFYWLAVEDDYEPAKQDPHIPGRGACRYPSDTFTALYTRDGFFYKRVSERYACSLQVEGSGLLADDRVVNTTGDCPWGFSTGRKDRSGNAIATCFEDLDVKEFPFGRGAGVRPLVPFKSVAVDPNVIHIGEPLYIPEFDGMVLPDGSIHDGCVRADDTGGGIKRRKMDFFVVTYGNFRFLDDELLDVSWVTPHVNAPRCEYLRDM
nr:3D domain-containing protein [Kofleriaceae bacterium]